LTWVSIPFPSGLHEQIARIAFELPEARQVALARLGAVRPCSRQVPAGCGGAVGAVHAGPALRAGRREDASFDRGVSPMRWPPPRLTRTPPLPSSAWSRRLSPALRTALLNCSMLAACLPQPLGGRSAHRCWAGGAWRCQPQAISRTSSATILQCRSRPSSPSLLASSGCLYRAAIGHSLRDA
jgi:hypothetical protein